jgi:hypothetical protein
LTAHIAVSAGQAWPARERPTLTRSPVTSIPLSSLLAVRWRPSERGDTGERSA